MTGVRWVCWLAALVLVFVVFGLRPIVRGRRRARMTEDLVNTLMVWDRNGDGRLDRSEVPERMQGLFERGDANHDGFLTPQEIRKLAEAQALPDR